MGPSREAPGKKDHTKKKGGEKKKMVKGSPPCEVCNSKAPAEKSKIEGRKWRKNSYIVKGPWREEHKVSNSFSMGLQILKAGRKKTRKSKNRNKRGK